MNVLVVAAHPDDEVFGCGGTIAAHAERGDNVFIISLADGVTSRFYRPGIKRKIELLRYKEAIEIRKKEFFNAAHVLGVNKENCACFGFADQRLDAIPLLDIIKRIEEKAQKIGPDLVYTHHWTDINRDHRICCEAVLTAFRPNRKTDRKAALFSFEIPGNMNFLPPRNVNKFKPTDFMDISNYLTTKLKAVEAYRSEFHDYPHPLSTESLTLLARVRGKGKKFEYAEAFERISL